MAVAGIFYDRFQGNPVFDMLPNPPSTNGPTFYYGNLRADSARFCRRLLPIGNVIGFDKNGQVPTTYNWNVTLQRRVAL